MALSEQEIAAVLHAIRSRLVGVSLDPLSPHDFRIDPNHDIAASSMVEVLRVDRVTYFEAVYCAKKVLVKVVPLRNFRSDSDDGLNEELTRQDMLEGCWMDATILASFTHDSIASFYGACFHGDVVMLIVECCNKLTLTNALRHTDLSWPAKLCLVRDVLKGVAVLHAAQIGHR